MSGRTKKMKKVVFATKMGSRKKSILAIFKKKLAILFSGKMLFLRQFLPEPINRQSPFIFLARSSGVSPLGKCQQTPVFGFNFWPKKTTMYVCLQMTNSANYWRFGPFGTLRQQIVWRLANSIYVVKKTTKHSSEREEASSLTDDTLSETAAYFPRQPSEHRWPS